MDKKIVLIDLDGTFVSVNTFHKWLKFLFIETIKKFQFISSIKILTIIALRYTKCIPHSKMKYMILKISEHIITQVQISHFVDTLKPHTHQKLINILQDTSKTTILATAAPLLYAQAIKEFYHFDFVLATKETTHTPWQENIRELKAQNVKKLFKQHAWDTQNSILYTDHYDDIPLMHIVSCTHLVNASEKTKMLTEKENIHTVVIDE